MGERFVNPEFNIYNEYVIKVKVNPYKKHLWDRVKNALKHLLQYLKKINVFT